MNPDRPKHILVVDDDQAVAKLVVGILKAEGYEAVVANSAEAGYELAVRDLPAMVVTDLVLPKMDGYGMCRMLRKNPLTRHLPILMMSSMSELEDKIKGFDAGVDDYLTKPFAPEEMRYRIKSLLTRASPPTQPLPVVHGKVIAFFGPKGGVGKTVLAVNTAIALKQAGKSVALVDVDYYFGNVGIQLNVSSRHSVFDLCATPVEEVEKEMVDEVMVAHSSGVRALLAPLHPEEAEHVTKALTEKTLDILTESHDFAIVDCPSNYDDRTLAALERADSILLVILPEIGVIKNLSSFLDLSEKLGLPMERFHLLLNRSDSEVGVDSRGIEKVLKIKIDFRLSSNGRVLPLSVNQGTPLILSHPVHPFSKQIQQLAQGLIRHYSS